MLNRLFILAAISTIMFLSTTVYGQSLSVKNEPVFRKPGYKVADRDVKAGVDIDTWVDQTAKDMKQVRPGAFTANPAADRAVVRSVFQSLKTRRESLSDEDILQVVFASWIELAIKGYDAQGKEVNYTEEDMLKVATSMSQLNVQTEPDGATIQVDDYEKTKKSNTNFWITEGKHMLLLRKPGYISQTENIEVNYSSKLIRLSVKLKPSK